MPQKRIQRYNSSKVQQLQNCLKHSFIVTLVISITKVCTFPFLGFNGYFISFVYCFIYCIMKNGHRPLNLVISINSFNIRNICTMQQIKFMDCVDKTAK